MQLARIKQIDRYVGHNTLQGVLLVLAGLVFLFSLFELLAQLNDVGKGAFGLMDAFAYVALTIPRKAVTLLPMSALVGSTVALGMMADHQELVAIQAAGISVQRICMAVLGASLIMMMLTLLVSEFIAPPLDQYARAQRSEARYGKTVLMSKSGFWVRQDQLFIHVGRTFSERHATDVEIYELTPDGRIGQFISARKATIHSDQNWLLEDVSRKVIEDDVVFDEQMNQYWLEHFLTPEQMQIFKLPPHILSLSDLYAYVQRLRASGQNAAGYDYAFWQNVCQPLTTCAMMLMALTFIFGPIRLRSAGTRIMTGIIVGIMLYLLNQIIGNIGLHLNLPPVLTSLLPVILILFFALRQLKRVF